MKKPAIKQTKKSPTLSVEALAKIIGGAKKSIRIRGGGSSS